MFYESPVMRAITGPALRPGGLELTRRALSFCELPAGARVLDIGCGTGVTISELRGRTRLKVSGLDRSAAMLARALQDHPGLPFMRAKATCLPVANGCLAAVICECVLSLVADPDAAWKELRRVLAPGGFLVLSDLYARAPEHAAGLASLPGTSCLKGAAPRHEIEARIYRFGFRLLVWEDHSAALKRLAAQMVFAGVSLPALWGTSGGREKETVHRCTVRRSRPGYFLLIARKEGPA